jgi:hypothetical protein
VAKLLRVGPEVFDLGPMDVIEGLFATITYCLEPNGRSSRFPAIYGLYEGRIGAADAPSALRELDQIEAALAELTPDRVVWTQTDLRRRDDRQLPVNHSAATVRDYFIAADNQPLLSVIRAAVLRGKNSNQPIELASAEVRRASRQARLYLIAGFLWTVIGYVFFPHLVYNNGDADGSSGFLIWPAGLFLFGAGVVMVFMARYPRLRERLDPNKGLSVLLVLAALGLYLFVAWSSSGNSPRRP